MKPHDAKYLALAEDMCKFGGAGNQFLGAVIATKTRILGTGANRQKTHPLQKMYGGEKRLYLHAEVDALISALRHNTLEKATIYIVRKMKHGKGERGLAKPCVNCKAAIIEAGIKRIVYSTNNGPVEELI